MSSANASRSILSQTVVVADDEEEIRRSIREYLEHCGYTVLEARNGLEVLLQVKRRRPGAVVLDLSMPRLGGLEALKRIRAFDPTITVVVVTGAPDPELQRRALSLGAVAVVNKPFDLKALASYLAGGVKDGQLGAREAQTVSGTSVASVDVPGSRSPDMTALVTPAPAAPAAGRVLVVDDEPMVREFLKEFLIHHGYETRCASDAATALHMLAEWLPDLVLLDINLPGLTGVEALPVIRAAAPEARVIMVSGTEDLAVSKRALAEGAFDYVPKPIDFVYLEQALDTAMLMKRLAS